MGTLGRILTRIIGYGLFFLSFLVPRNRRIWAFGSSAGTRFADNGKWMFLHCVHGRPGRERHVWFTRDPAVYERMILDGFDVRKTPSLRALWTSMRAGVWFFDGSVWDIGYWTSSRAIKVNLWHGMPMKRIRLAMASPTHPDYAARHGRWHRRMWTRLSTPWSMVTHHMQIATSRETRRRISQAFGIAPERVPITGQPRTDILLAPDVPPGVLRNPIVAEARDHRKAGGPVVVYLPTYRDNADPGERHPPLDWRKLEGLAARRQALVVVKIHPWAQTGRPDDAELPHLRFVGPRFDVSPLLRYADALVTDYSSLAYDYLLLDRPLFFFAYDLTQYQRRDRELYDDYEAATPGPIARTSEELLDQLDAWLDDPDQHDAAWAAARDEQRRRMHDHVDAHAARRIVAEIESRFLK